MNVQRPNRKTYEESCELLQKLGYLEQGEIPPIPDHPPHWDDDESLGVGFFRTFIEEGDLENLTLPRTFFGRSAVGPISFKNADLSESSLCWNDFNEVDFTDADCPSPSRMRSMSMIAAKKSACSRWPSISRLRR
jgi:BTB/POZ domain-containing protein KCTD9